MILYIVRHGKPDYETDTLLPEGWEQAHLVAQRLSKAGITQIHASTMERAQQTAQPLAELLRLPIQLEPWAIEMGEETLTRYPDGNLHSTSLLPTTHLHQEKYRTVSIDDSFNVVDGFSDSQLKEKYKSVANGLDGMLETLGYRRNERGFYDVVVPNDEHIALFCHAGMLRMMISHLFHIPFQLVCSTFHAQYTGITTVYFTEKPLQETSPSLYTFGEAGHLHVNNEPIVHYFNQQSI